MVRAEVNQAHREPERCFNSVVFNTNTFSIKNMYKSTKILHAKAAADPGPDIGVLSALAAPPLTRFFQ